MLRRFVFAAIVVAALGGCTVLAGIADYSAVPCDGVCELPREASSDTPNASSPDGGNGDDAARDGADAAFADAAAWTPASLGFRLQVWLDATKGVVLSGGRVIRWEDQSGSQNHATQSLNAAQPILSSAVINGRDAITFDGRGTWLSIADATPLHWRHDDFAVAIVARYVNVPSTDEQSGSAAFWSKTDPTAPYAGTSLLGNEPLPTVGGPTSALAAWLKSPRDRANGNAAADSMRTGLDDGRFRVFAMRRIGQFALEARVSGTTTVANVGGVEASAIGQPIKIGCAAVAGSASRGRWLDGSIAEIVAVFGPMTDAEMDALEAYLRSKYGL